MFSTMKPYEYTLYENMSYPLYNQDSYCACYKDNIYNKNNISENILEKSLDNVCQCTESQSLLIKSLSREGNAAKEYYEELYTKHSKCEIQNQSYLYDKELEIYIKNNYCVCEVDNFNPENNTKLENSIQSNSFGKNGTQIEEINERRTTYTNHNSNIQTQNKRSNIIDDLNLFANDESNPLISKTVEEVLRSQSLNAAAKLSPNYGKSKRRLYYLRPDVITKIIFRCMRKHYMKDFKAIFDFTKCNCDDISDPNGELIKQVNRYLNKKIGESKLSNMDTYFISLIDIKEKFNSINDEHRKFKENISGLLSCYNKPKFMSLITKPQFAQLLFAFLNKRDILRLVVKSKNEVDVIQAYSEQIQMLKCQCNMSLAL